MTDKLEREAEDYIRQIEDMGGVIAGIENGFFQKEIARAAYRHQRELDEGRRVIVGVNKFEDPNERIEIPILKITEEVEEKQRTRLADLRRRRDDRKVQSTLERLQTACENGENVMPHLIDCAHADVTLGEMVRIMEKVYGAYIETAHF